ncbi:uncharacterized protein [Aegilops tauschii subsp. strangulata]|uniref:uncharacterized protein n=1 Tax=Aegilops tauschii subsp. strangulata TaxID=200361 RepID=UPI000845046C|nr:uncharacterized protein LOC109759941 [Aegilops tauschii subsp. strangulata]XP_044400984.1 uncharacterized protein LOC123124433 [Triticum aestivum]
MACTFSMLLASTGSGAANHCMAAALGRRGGADAGDGGIQRCCNRPSMALPTMGTVTTPTGAANHGGNCGGGCWNRHGDLLQPAPGFASTVRMVVDGDNGGRRGGDNVGRPWPRVP